MEHYERMRVIGRGAFGTVYLCRRLIDGKEVIIKQIPIEQLNKMDRQSTINEVRVLAMLDHPNIIEYYDSFIQDQAMMIVMEYAAGGTLYDYLEKHANEETYLAEEEIAFLFSQIVLPLKHVHSSQILHRDLKSQNIFLAGNLVHVKIGDFGISKILTSKSKAYSVVGTPCYISPELCEGKPYNQKSDIWALGCVLYEMCTLKRAFEAPTLPALVLKIMRGTYQPIPSHYSPILKELVAALLATDPSKRFNLSQLMAHPWVSVYLYKLPTTLGFIPCTAKSPRPISVPQEEFSSTLFLHATSNGRGRTSSFFSKADQTFLKRWKLSADHHAKPTEDTLCLPRRVNLKAICPNNCDKFTGISSDGKITEWDFRKLTPPRTLDGLTGITIVSLCCTSTFTLLLTDRGLLMSHGEGRLGCLGHGDLENVQRPKIIESLLGEEIKQMSCSESHVSVLTTEHDVLTWGFNGQGCLGLGIKDKTRVVPSPSKVDLEEDLEFSEVKCGQMHTQLLTKGGLLLLAGDFARKDYANGRFRCITEIQGNVVTARVWSGGVVVQLEEDRQKGDPSVKSQLVFLSSNFNSSDEKTSSWTSKRFDIPAGNVRSFLCSENLIALSTDKDRICYYHAQFLQENPRQDFLPMKEITPDARKGGCHQVDGDGTQNIHDKVLSLGLSSKDSIFVLYKEELLSI